MPAFVIHRLGQNPQSIVVETPPVRVGRDPTCDLALPDDTVSREHAVFMRDAKGRWHVTCVSDTNPIVVDGALVRQGCEVTEGSEVVVGSEHLIIFSESAATASAYLGPKKGLYAREECAKCHWQGIVSHVRGSAVCPRCGAMEFLPRDSYRPAGAAEADTGRATMTVDPAAARAVFKTLRAAKRSYLERIDGRDDGPQRRELAEGEALVLARGEGSAFPLSGVVVGSARVAWSGTRYVVESELTYPPLKVNGARATSAALEHGAVIEVGSNRFRYVVAGD